MTSTSGQWLQVVLPAPNLVQILITSPSPNLLVDDLTWADPVTTFDNTVPEPSTLFLAAAADILAFCMPLTSLTARIRQMLRGDKVSEEAVFAELYGSLRSAARLLLSREGASEWSPTDLVNETYARQLSRGKYAITDRHHFIRLAQRAMRHVLIDAARSRQSSKRGAGLPLASLNEAALDLPAASFHPEEILSLYNAIDALARLDHRAAGVFELRHFFGYSTAEVAEILRLSPERVRDDWDFSRTWLRDRIFFTPAQRT